MTIERLREAHKAEPFIPFEICLAEGRRILVPSPEFLLMAPRAERTFVVAEDPENYRVIDLLLVSSIDFSSPRKSSNGHPRRR